MARTSAAGLESVSSGTIRIDERDITHLPPRDRDVAMVVQDYARYPHMTVREILSLGLRLRKLALGGTSHIHFEVGANRLLVTATGEQLPDVEDTVDVWIPSERVHLFGAEGRAGTRIEEPS